MNMSIEELNKYLQKYESITSLEEQYPNKNHSNIYEMASKFVCIFTHNEQLCIKEVVFTTQHPYTSFLYMLYDGECGEGYKVHTENIIFISSNDECSIEEVMSSNAEYFI